MLQEFVLKYSTKETLLRNARLTFKLDGVSINGRVLEVGSRSAVDSYYGIQTGEEEKSQCVPLCVKEG